MLGADVAVAEAPGLLLRTGHCLSRRIAESLEHVEDGRPDVGSASSDPSAPSREGPQLGDGAPRPHAYTHVRALGSRVDAGDCRSSG